MVTSYLPDETKEFVGYLINTESKMPVDFMLPFENKMLLYEQHGR